MPNIPQIWSLLDNTSDGISYWNFFHKEFWILLSHVCVTVTLGWCVASAEHDLNFQFDFKQVGS